MTTQVHQKINKINSDIERLILEKENLKKHLKSELTAIFDQLSFEEYDFDDVVGGLHYLKNTLLSDNENSKEILCSWKNSYKKISKNTLKKSKQK